jgi:hypothetical protein
MRSFVLSAIASLAFLFSAAVPAVVVYKGDPPRMADPNGLLIDFATLRLADSFTIPATFPSTMLEAMTPITFWVWEELGSTWDDIINYVIYSDAGGQPGAVKASGSGTADVSRIQGGTVTAAIGVPGATRNYGLSEYQFLLQSSVGVAASERLWLEIGMEGLFTSPSGNPGGFLWAYSTSSADAGKFSSAGGPWSDVPGGAGFSFGVGVPVPSSVWLVALGVICAGTLARRGQAQASSATYAG